MTIIGRFIGILTKWYSGSTIFRQARFRGVCMSEQYDVPLSTLAGFVGASYSQTKRAVLMNGLRGLRRVQANRAWEDWLSVLNAFTVLTEDCVTELKESGSLDAAVDFRSVDTAKGSPFQRSFLPRWERFEALLGANHKPLTKGERGNLRELVKNPKVLVWYAGLKPERQRQLTHPNRIILGWKSANRSPSDEATKPSLPATQQRIISALDDDLAETKKRVTELQSKLDDHDWNAAAEIDQLVNALTTKLRTRTASEQFALLETLAQTMGFADIIKSLARRK